MAKKKVVKDATSRADGGELCRCGHLSNQHGHVFPPIKDYGGSCKVAGCDCGRFTWKSFVGVRSRK